MSKKRSSKQDNSRRYLMMSFVAGFVVFLVVAVIYVTQSDSEDTSQGTLSAEVSVEDALELREQGAFILDVREQSEWDDFHIPGATLIPLGELSSRLSEVPEDQDIVVVCRSGNRSQSGRDILADAGFSQVTSMRGGVSEWRSMGFPIE